MIALITTIEYHILKENLNIAKHLRLCAKANCSLDKEENLLHRAIQLEQEYRELKKKYKGKNPTYII